MGKKHRKSNKRGPNKRSETWSDAPPVETPLFGLYYKAQEVVPEEEWDQFIKALREPLPTTFRLTSSRAVAPRLNQQIQEKIVPSLTGLQYEGIPLEAPRKLPWYPGGLAWQLQVPRQAIRKQPSFQKFQHFLVHEADSGNLSRQEAVSMIPPLLLDVEPGHYVLDMCAAPGSKSVQLLEALNTPIKEESEDEGKEGKESSGKEGLLIANDSDAKRCHLLVHQSLHRVPGSSMMVTNHDATQLPGLRLPALNSNSNSNSTIEKGKFKVDDENEEELVQEGKKSKYQPLLYDRILADVPCSGDGTLRKNIAIWREFTPGNGIGLHALQLRILLRGIALLKPGGRLVYSTCSMNPLENEAVISAALSLSPEMTILDVSSSLPELKRRPGKTDWKVMDNKCEIVAHPDSTEGKEGESEDRNGHKKPWVRTLWPCGKEKDYGLEKCVRIYPHLQDTGAFFVCVLVKAENKKEETVVAQASKRSGEEAETGSEAKKPKSEVDAEVMKVEVPVVEAAQIEAAKLPSDVVGAKVVAKRKPSEFKEEPFVYLDPEDEQVKLCIEFFDLSSSFPVTNLLVRNASGAPLRSMYFTSSITRSLLLSNSFTRMRLISCGVKIFTRQDSSKDGTYRCKWRVMSEGLEVLRPFMGPKRIVNSSVETLKTLMTSLTVGITTLEEAEFKSRIDEMETGSFVLEVDAKGGDLLFEQKLTLPAWKSKSSVQIMVEKSEKSALSLRLFGEDVTPHKPPPKARDVAAAAKVAKAAEVKDGEGEADENVYEADDAAEGDDGDMDVVGGEDGADSVDGAEN